MKSVHQPCLAWIPIKGCFANSEDPDEISQIAIFHQGLHCYSIFSKRNTLLFQNYNQLRASPERRHSYAH